MAKRISTEGQVDRQTDGLNDRHHILRVWSIDDERSNFSICHEKPRVFCIVLHLLTWYKRIICGCRRSFIICISRKIFCRLSSSNCVLSIIFMATWNENEKRNYKFCFALLVFAGSSLQLLASLKRMSTFNLCQWNKSKFARKAIPFYCSLFCLCHGMWVKGVQCPLVYVHRSAK